MSWNVQVLRSRDVFLPASDGNPSHWEKREVTPPVCRLSLPDEVELDADNLRILIDALHCALDILQPDLGVKQPDFTHPVYDYGVKRGGITHMPDAIASLDKEMI